MIYIIAIFGFVVGSFLNVCIYRIPRKETVVTTPSHCTSCGTQIKWYDLIPIISYLFLSGKCRGCSKKISMQYPIVEFVNGVLWACVYVSFGLSVNSAFYMVLCSALLVIALIDYKSLIIPDGILIFLLIFGVISNIIELNTTSMMYAVIGFFIISVPLLLISMITKGGIGGGDIKLMAVCGLYLGFKLAVAGFFLGVLFAAILSAALLALKVKKKGDIIPLGPFLAMGLVLSIFIGNSLIEWYMRFFI